MTTQAGHIRGKGLWKKVRLTILARDNHTCQYCGHYPANTIDHIQPLSHGGSPYDEMNLTTACGKCNSSKGNRTNHTLRINRTNNTSNTNGIMHINSAIDYNQNIFSDGGSTFPLATPVYFSRGDLSDLGTNSRDNMSGLGGNGRDLTVNVLGRVPFE